jgi:DNA-directed RNA polymerase II subunit RPB2
MDSKTDKLHLQHDGRDMLGIISGLSWDIIESYYDKSHLEKLVRHQLESYNYFISSDIQRTIQMFNPVVISTELEDNETSKIDTTIHFTNFKILRPQIFENNGSSKIMYPNEARLRNFTYSSQMTVDINITYDIYTEGSSHTVTKMIPSINIGKIPIMLNSCLCSLKHTTADPVTHDECAYDTGGYFIINGSEKTVIGQERAAENIINCFHMKKNTKWSWLAEIRCVPDFKQISPKVISMMISSKVSENGRSIYVDLPKIKQPVPLFTLFKALGITSDKEICKYILLNIDDNDGKFLKLLKASIVDSNTIHTQEEAFEYIMSHVQFTSYKNTTGQQERKIAYTKEILSTEFFPHCRTETEKLFMLGMMCLKLIKTSIGILTETDRDSYDNKRVDTCGILLNNLFRNNFNKMVKDMQKHIRREVINGSWKTNQEHENIINMTNIYKIVKASTIENGFKRALATGDFGIANSKSNKVGVAQVLNRLTYISTLSHLRRINTPIDKSGKLIPPRKLHNSSWGFICPAETPEGHSVGVVKNMSYLTHITLPSPSEPIYSYLVGQYTPITSETTPDSLYNKVKVVINGNWCGITDDPMKLYKDLKMKKEQGIINIFTSIVFNYSAMEIHICTAGGRLTRPVYRVNNQELRFDQEIIDAISSHKFSWDDLLTNIKFSKGLIEYIDPAEQNNSLIAMKYKKIDNPRYTHCEIHPSTIFGILASCIPFPEHNQSPRNTYQCAMGKQAMGIYTTNHSKRMDKTAYVLSYPMRPLVDTRVMNYIQLHKIPSGCPVVVAIMSHTGYNQEDSILFNKGAVDRGLFQATLYKTEKDEDKKLYGDAEIRCRPDPSKTKGMKFGNYDKINGDGVIPENMLVQDKDIIMAKIVPIKENRNDHTKTIKYEDFSMIHRTNEDVYVDKNYLNRNGDGYNLCKVKLRAMRTPNIGDKFSSRHGQKGTIGNIIPEEDMPYTENGVKPDIIINPHAIPSRMTIAQLKETLLGKALLELGLFGDGTSFEEFNIKDIRKRLLEVNYECNGNELLYNGLTGEQMETSIFIGPCFYQRLKHMVADKQHSRSIGPMVNLTRQPAEGRSRDGGLRFGEMERDCMISHGASRFTKERIYDVSDAFKVHVCKDCGSIAAFNTKHNIYHCNMCENTTNFAQVNIPYSCKLLFQELMTMNIAPRIVTN